MALVFVLGLWMCIGGSVYRAHKRARPGTENPAPAHGNVALGHRRVRAEIPDTVPLQWIEDYQAEHGG
jgi:hypothetical protein